MKYSFAISIIAFGLACLSSAVRADDAANSPRLWFSHSAKQWIDGLPIGNGRMGAMVMGGTADERIQFNEDTLWTGQPHNYVRAGAFDSLANIRQLVFDGKAKEAGELVRAKFLSDPVRQKAYQPFGDLHLQFAGHETVTDYRRELDLGSAMAVVTYTVGDVQFHREVFASFPDQVIVIHQTASKPGQLNFTVKMDSPHRGSQTLAVDGATLVMSGQVADGGTKFQSGLHVQSVQGADNKVTVNDDGIAIEKANEVTLVLSAATSFKNFQDVSADPAVRCNDLLAKVKDKDYASLLAAHEADYRQLFDRVSLNVGKTDRADLPTDERVAAVNKLGLDGDPSLAALDFQFGRYLLISSSRAGSQPANLQGVWNDMLSPPWESKWTTNINLEMNYWLAEPTNLSDCTAPLFDLIDDLVISGTRTAQGQYHCRGWVLHHNTDLWRGTAPINNTDGVWPTGGAWLCYHLWEHYLFTGDKAFLARAYPAMKQASLFFVDYLIKDPKTGWLVTNPSFSPEQGELCAGPAMDCQFIRALFDSTIQAAQILGVDAELSAQLRDVRGKIVPNQIGHYGQLQEWEQDVDEPNNNHRHMSPLWGLYPGAQFTPNDVRLFEAAKLLLKWRGDGSTGWSFAWRIPLWARVHDGEFAYRQLGLLLAKRTFPNLLDKCGPFQIDGNFGMTAGIAEMLLQSHIVQSEAPKARLIELLPALPKAWPKGSVTGLCARGGFEVDETWENGALTHAVIRSKLGNPCRVQYGEHAIDLATEAGKAYALDGSLTSP